jgi:hypothetical protein
LYIVTQQETKEEAMDRDGRQERRERGRHLTVQAEVKAFNIKWDITPSFDRIFTSLRKAEALAVAHTTKDKE